MRYLLTCAIAIALVASSWAGVTRAQTNDDLLAQAPGPGAPGPGAPGPGGPGPFGPGFAQRLGLTEAQAKRVEQILAAHRERTARLRIALSRARLDARELMLEAKPDRAKIEAISRRIGDLHGQLARAHMEFTLELKQILTPEQWTRFQGMRDQWRRARPARTR